MGLGFMFGFVPLFPKKSYDYPSIRWLHQKFKCIPERNANEPAKVFPLTSFSF